MYKKFQLNRTKIKGAVSREEKGGQVYTWAYMPLGNFFRNQCSVNPSFDENFSCTIN